MPTTRRQGERASGKKELRSCKFRIHSNHVEVEYEGSETFAVERLLPAIERLSKAKLDVNTSSSPDSSAGASSMEAPPVQEIPHPTTREIGDKIGAEDWDDLALAACGHLTLARQLASYSQDQMLEQMRLGPDCSKSEMNRALSRILKDMVKRGNLEKKESGYALSEKMRESLAQRLTWKD